MMASTLSRSVSSAARRLSANPSRNPSCLRAEAATFASAYTYTLAFSLVSNDDKGHDVDARQLKAALLARIENLDEEGSWIESAGAPYDTYLEPEEAP